LVEVIAPGPGTDTHGGLLTIEDVWGVVVVRDVGDTMTTREGEASSEEGDTDSLVVIFGTAHGVHVMLRGTEGGGHKRWREVRREDESDERRGRRERSLITLKEMVVWRFTLLVLQMAMKGSGEGGGGGAREERRVTLLNRWERVDIIILAPVASL
jgi:hypothetical protein